MESGEEKRRRIVGLLSLLLLLTGLGTLVGLALLSSENSRVEIIRDKGQSGEREAEIVIVVDVAGAVERPGVYKLWQGARIVDALAAAGGLSEMADRGFLSKTINLSQLVTDGMKIYLPAVNIGNVDITGTTDSIDNSNIIYINSASTEELESLWGVGEARAKAIINGRPYSSIEDLVTKKILPKNVVEKNKNRLSL